MSVEHYQNKPAHISISEKAQQHIEKQLKKRAAQGLRLSTKSAGCSGFRYELTFVEQAGENDIAIPISPSITLFIQQKDQALLNGIEIDFVTEGLNSSFKFNNPNASGTCGCGESFTVN